MDIENHLLTKTKYIESPNKSGNIVPKFVVMHYTATPDAKSAINWLINKRSKASAHVVVDLDGVITQLVPFNKKAWHAGPSEYHGYSGLNNFSIGIEIVNIGWLRTKRGGEIIDSYGSSKKETDFPHGLIESHSSRVGNDLFLWPVYPEKQLNAISFLTKKLIEQYNIIDIVSHEEIDTRGWKTDPGPAFPLNHFKNLLPTRNTNKNTFEVTAPVLNVRSGPGVNFNIIGKIHQGDVIQKESIHKNWIKIDDAGWVHKQYLRFTN